MGARPVIRERGKSASSRAFGSETNHRIACTLQFPSLYGHEYTPRPRYVQARYTLRYTPEGGFPWAGSYSAS